MDDALILRLSNPTSRSIDGIVHTSMFISKAEIVDALESKPAGQVNLQSDNLSFAARPKKSSP